MIQTQKTRTLKIPLHLALATMRWIAPLERREVALVFVSLAVYFLAYNFEMSVEFLGIDPVATHRVVFGGFGLGETVIGKDGRKPPGWRDTLEADVYGEWNWDEGHIAFDPMQKLQLKESGKSHDELTVNDALQRWGKDIPQTQLLKHAPGLSSSQNLNLLRFTIRLGYTIIDNLYICSGSVYLVSDNEQYLPPLSSILASKGEGFHNFSVLSLEKAREVLGSFGGV